MNFIKRAWLSTKAKKGHSVILFLVFSAILIFVLAGLTIQNASNQSLVQARQEMGGTVTLSVNREATMKKAAASDSASSGSNGKIDPGSFKATPVSLDQANLITGLDHVKSYNYLSETSAGAENFKPISSSNSTSSGAAPSQGPMDYGMNNMGVAGDLTVEGVLSTENLSDFTTGTNTFTEGNGITADDVNTNDVVIESSLADANNLKTGDTITISSPTDSTKTYNLTIKGVYKTTATTDPMAQNFSFLNASNKIYVSYTLANELKGSDYSNAVDSVVINLDDPQNMDAYVTAAKATGLDTETYSLQTDTALYEQMISPLENVANFAQKIVILVAVAGVIILSLIVIMSIRERKFEMGVLLSLGESRWKLVAQFFIELIIVFIAALVVAGFSGKYVGNVLGQQLLDQQTTAQTTSMTPQAGPGGNFPAGDMGGPFRNFGASSSASAIEIDNLNIALSVSDLVELGGIGLGICFLSVVISSIGIIRLDPKKILIM